MIEVYKAVMPTKRLDTYTSMVIRKSDAGIFERTYIIGGTTRPPRFFPNAWLMAFKDRFSAIAFFGNNVMAGQGVIFRASTSEIREPDLIRGDLSLSELIRYWEKHDSIWAATYPPFNTVLCKDIKLIEQVYPEVNNGKTSR